MKVTKPVIIVLAVALVAVIGYTFYLHQGPYKKISTENQELINEIARLEAVSEEIKAGHKTDLAAKIRLIERLQTKEGKLEERLSRLGKEKETVEADLQKKLGSLKNQLVQRERDLQTSRNETQQLRTVETELQGNIKRLENQLVQKEHEIQIFHDETQPLHKTIVILESNRDTLIKKSAELNRQLQESKNQIEGLNQKMAAREEKLGNMAKDRQALVRQIDSLEEERRELNQKTHALEKKLSKSKDQLHATSQNVASREEQFLAMQKTHEKLVKRLSKQIQENELEISAMEGRLNIRLLDKILFAPGNAVITPNGKRVLKSLTEEFKKLEGVHISVEGHTDNQPLGRKIRPIYHDNLGLSVARSAAVVRTLRTMGVHPQILSAAGYSMYRPVAGNTTPEDRQQNRRVEIILAPRR